MIARMSKHMSSFCVKQGIIPVVVVTLAILVADARYALSLALGVFTVGVSLMANHQKNKSARSCEKEL